MRKLGEFLHMIHDPAFVTAVHLHNALFDEIEEFASDLDIEYDARDGSHLCPS